MNEYYALRGKMVRFHMRDGSAITGLVYALTPAYDNDPEIDTVSIWRNGNSNMAGLEPDIPEIASYEILK